VAVGDEADVAQETFVENAIGSLAIVNAAMRLADHTRPRGWNLSF
jgi:hypothetical protein